MNLWVSVLFGSMMTSCAFASEMNLRSLNGQWQGDDLALTINIDTLQANTNPEMPFEWNAFHLINITKDIFVFDIGQNRFIALIEPDGQTMTVTIAGAAGQHILRHTRTR